MGRSHTVEIGFLCKAQSTRLDSPLAMSYSEGMPLELVSLDELEIDDERSLRHIAVYRQLKAMLIASGYRFHRPAAGTWMSWDRALFLNLTFWNASEGADVLCDEHI